MTDHELSTCKGRPLAALALLALASPAVLAEPSVVGNRIVLPDDGWYQVQSAATYQQICAGERQCDVADGLYIVINHSTGQRWESIQVPAAVGQTVLVDGNTIVMNGPGWFQVQDATTYDSLCQGVSRCEVPNGTYQVINHDSGQRWESIVVNTSQSLADRVSVQGNTISIAGVGWFQVQDAIDYQTLCNGEVQCTVSDGRYIVIDHTSGERLESVVVGGGNSPGENPPPVLHGGNAEAVLASVIDIINEVRLQEIFVIAATDLRGFRDPSRGAVYFEENAPAPESIAIYPNYDPVTLAGNDPNDAFSLGLAQECPGGGSAHYYYRDGNGAQLGEYEFDGCHVGSNIYHGSAGLLLPDNLFDRQNVAARQLRIDSADGSRRSVSGFATFNNRSAMDTTLGTYWQDGFLDIQAAGTSLVVEQYNASRRIVDEYSLRHIDNETATLPNGELSLVADYQRAAELSGSFVVRADWSGQESIDVDFTFDFQDRIRYAESNPEAPIDGMDPSLPFSWQSASIVLRASDGSTLETLPIDTGRFDILLGDGARLGPYSWAGRFNVLCSPELATCFAEAQETGQ